MRRRCGVPWTVPAGHRLGFFYELVATLCLPVTTFVVILLLALLLYGLELRSNRRSRWPLEPHTGCSMAKYPGQSNVRSPLEPVVIASRPAPCAAHRRAELLNEAKARKEARVQAHGTEVARPVKRAHRTQRGEDSLLKMLNRPQVWTLNILAWLMLYPSVTRKALKTFDCVDLLGERYLRSDPAIRCSGDQYDYMRAVAWVGVVVGCVLAPLVVIWQTTRKHASPDRTTRARRTADLLVPG